MARGISAEGGAVVRNADFEGSQLSLLGVEELSVDGEELGGGATTKERKGSSKRQVVLSERDFEILRFILEMKFSSLDEVCEKFFKGGSADHNVVGYWYGKKRLARLEGANYLKSTRHFSSNRRLYFATRRSYQALINLWPAETFPKASSAIDGRTVAHDYLVLKLRMEMERRHLAHRWISEKSLKQAPGFYRELGDRHLPDGIYQPIQGKPVAFELEIALKSKSRYQEKIKRYVNWMRVHKENPMAFHKVHFFIMKDSVKGHLEHLTRIYPDFFQLTQVSDFISDGELFK